MGVLYLWGVFDMEGHRAYILHNTYTNVSGNVPRDLNAVGFFKTDTKKKKTPTFQTLQLCSRCELAVCLGRLVYA